MSRPAYLQENWDTFKDLSVAQAYRSRCPYPEEVIATLRAYAQADPRAVVDLGCGTGEIARRLAPSVRRIDAVDTSAAMLQVAATLPGGDCPNIRWHCCHAEDFSFPSTYSLAVAAGSLHWMEWDTVLPRIGGALVNEGSLAIVLGGGATAHVPWQSRLNELIPQYSTIRNWEPFDLMAELESEGLFLVQERFTTQPMPHEQSVDAYIEHFHSQAAFSRGRMSPERAAEFDAKVREAVAPFGTPEGLLRFDVQCTVACGRPARRPSRR